LGVKMLSSIFEQFVQESPVSVMARVLMERIFAPERMDGLFTRVCECAIPTGLT
jgi:hypothetical protein